MCNRGSISEGACLFECFCVFMELLWPKYINIWYLIFWSSLGIQYKTYLGCFTLVLPCKMSKWRKIPLTFSVMMCFSNVFVISIHLKKYPRKYLDFFYKLFHHVVTLDKQAWRQVLATCAQNVNKVKKLRIIGWDLRSWEEMSTKISQQKSKVFCLTFTSMWSWSSTCW